MHKTLITLSVLILISFLSYGQQHLEKTGLTKHLEIESKYLGEKREVEIYFPPSYQGLEIKKYPVMYVMDGQEYFLHPVAYQKMLRFKDKSPEFIVVGINSDRKKRRILYHQDASRFINFIKKELIPLIDENYRTLEEKERIYFGWEMAGGLGLEIFANHPNMFSAFFLASPTHFTEDRIAALDKTTTENTPYLYFSKAPEETYIEKSLNEVDSVFKTRNPKHTFWKVDNLLGEDHYTTPLKTISNGLRDYFKDYNTLRFYSLKEFDEFGNLDSIKKYYRHRGNRYGISTDVHRTTKHFLLLNAMTENKFERFEEYANEFGKYLSNPTREIWAVRFGNYFAENNKDKEALDIYESGLNKFPESPAIHNAIGTFYTNKGNEKKARIHYKLAIEYAEKNDDSELGQYKSDLGKL
ncbi:alpha/beta hydrolase-fold protein [Galbibacter sp. EGI 63066]|uniref:alpha/beta hydrolase-fold protein n=1 Tax=Galbibacter sp. EGI 63066 TaxID=2993559 RepID=UPI0022498A47|nr:alpha/beta hydrolase-fold protein [Galbibacter sp. EGI 63066]MCX2681705.1 alpha/beta hydrolase-fold protein [Galbibacter sp. EGI 63066]